MKSTEKELKEYADMKAENIVIRTWRNGNSSDDVRSTTDAEKAVISSIIFGGLLAIRHGSDKQSVQNACEYIGNIQMHNIVTDGEMNGYDTIYSAIREFPEIS